MAIITPPVYTPVHREEVLVNESVQEELVRKLIHNNNFLIDLMPIRSIVFVEVNQVGVPLLDTSRWQECNGSEITNPNSPLRTIGADTRFVPDLRNRYVRATVTEGATNQFLGSQTHNFQHDHGGFTQQVGFGPFIYESGGDRRRRVPHFHAIAEQFSENEFLDAPQYTHLIAYMRVA